MIILIQIKPIEDLKENFHDIEKKAEEGEHIYLTKNGYGKYAIVDIESYDRFVNGMKVLKDLQEASAESGLYTLDDVFGELDK